MSIHLHMLPPSVNNLTVRVFLRAAGLPYDRGERVGQDPLARVPGEDPRPPDAGDRGRRSPARRDVGELRDHDVPREQAPARVALPDRPRAPRADRLGELLPDGHALSARRALDLSAPRLPVLPRRGRRAEDAATDAEDSARKRRRGRDRRAARGVPQVLRARRLHRRRRHAVDRRHPVRRDARVPRAERAPLPQWAKDYVASGREGSARRTASRRPTCAASSTTCKSRA